MSSFERLSSVSLVGVEVGLGQRASEWARWRLVGLGLASVGLVRAADEQGWSIARLVCDVGLKSWAEDLRKRILVRG